MDRRSPSLRARRRPAGSMRRRGRRSGLPRTSLLATSASSSRGRTCEPKKAWCFTRSARKRAARGRADPVGSSQMRLSSFVPLARDVVIAGSPFVAGDVSGTTTGSRRCGRLPHSPLLRRERLARAVLLVAGDHFGVAADVGIFGDAPARRRSLRGCRDGRRDCWHPLSCPAAVGRQPPAGPTPQAVPSPPSPWGYGCVSPRSSFSPFGRLDVTHTTMRPLRRRQIGQTAHPACPYCKRKHLGINAHGTNQGRRMPTVGTSQHREWLTSEAEGRAC